MVTVLEACTTEEQRSVMRFFLWALGLNAKDIHKEKLPVYVQKCLPRKAVHNWVEKFSQGISKVADVARPGRPVEIATEGTVQRVEELIRADRRITIDSVATALGCSRGLAYSIKNGRLKLRKVWARWVPTELKDREKNEPNGSVLATSLTVCRRRRRYA
jgi:transposase